MHTFSYEYIIALSFEIFPGKVLHSKPTCLAKPLITGSMHIANPLIDKAGGVHGICIIKIMHCSFNHEVMRYTQLQA